MRKTSVMALVGSFKKCVEYIGTIVKRAITFESQGTRLPCWSRPMLRICIRHSRRSDPGCRRKCHLDCSSCRPRVRQRRQCGGRDNRLFPVGAVLRLGRLRCHQSPIAATSRAECPGSLCSLRSCRTSPVGPAAARRASRWRTCGRQHSS